jgi:hypothetical protein
MMTRPEPAAPDGTSPGRCTGPRTDAGKEVSSMNAVTHGLTARTPLLPGEDPDAFRRFVWDVVADLEPCNKAQGELAHRAAVLMWKRRRLDEAERQVMEELTDQYTRDQEDEAAAAAKEGPADVGGDDDDVDPSRVARLILADEFASKPDQLERLERYEHRVSQQIQSTIRLLLKLQNRKDWREAAQRKANGPTPAADPRPEPAPAAAADASPPPPAPAQNELPPATPETPAPAPRGAWTGPPGMN